MTRLALLLFFLSGAFGLIYQVVWTRTMTHAFGVTALAVGTVLAAFMCGLAGGSWLIGRAADRSAEPLKLYARLELGVGLAGLVAHLLLERIAPAYLFVYELFGRSDLALALARFGLAFTLVLAPTVLMGATLPVLSRFVVTSPSTVGASLSSLYAVNTLGAVVGTLLTGFYLIGAFGIHGAIALAVAGNLGVGAIAWAASRRLAASGVEKRQDAPGSEQLGAGSPPAGSAGTGRGAAPPADSAGRARPGGRDRDTGAVSPLVWRLVLGGLAVSGLTSFAYEIYWTRSLIFLVGNSTYAVSSMLAAFLAGIALGGLVARFLIDRVRDRVALFGWLQLGIAAASAGALPALFALVDPESLRVHLGEMVFDPGRLLAARFAVVLGVMLVPATLIGMTFPLVARIGVADLAHTGAVVGRVYAVNTIGNVAGALLPGLFLISWLGIQSGILLMAALNALVAVVVLGARMRAVPALRWALPVGLVASVVALGSAPLGFRFPSKGQAEYHRVLFYREGPSATTQVLLDPDTRERSMSVDGVTIGGTVFTEFKQLLLAHLPKLLTDDVSRELSIGLGSAMLVGESARHARVEHIVCAELEPSVVEGARYFTRENHGVLDEPKLELVLDDVANHLRTTHDVYDVISADEKTDQEYASNGFSYSREYYELLRGRLAPGGVVVQWVPNTLPLSQYGMVLRTFTEAFPYVQLWFFPPAYQQGAANTILVGSARRIELDADRVRARLARDPEAFASLARYGLTSAEGLLAHLVAEEEAIRRAVAGSPVNTLVHPRYEFYSLADYASPESLRLRVNLNFLVHLRSAAGPALLDHLRGRDDSGGERLAQAYDANGKFLDALGGSLRGIGDAEALSGLEAALEAAPWNDSLRAQVAVQVWEIASRYSGGGNFAVAADLMRRALEIHGESAMAHVTFALVLGRVGRREEALKALERAVELDPRLVAARRVRADLLMAAGRPGDAALQLQALLKVEPRDADARTKLKQLGVAVPP